MKARRIQTHRVIDAVEAAYALDGTHDAWLARLLDAVHADLDLGAGIYTFSARLTEGRFVPDSAFTSHQLDPHFFALLERLNRDPPKELLDVLGRSLVRAGGLEEILGRDHAVTRHFRATAQGTGFVDGFTMFAQDGEGRGLCLSAPARAVVAHGEDARAVWLRAGLHFAAALRLRQRLAIGASPCEALVTPSGDVADARGALRDDAGLRARLRAAVTDAERARTRKVRRDPNRALRLWRGLVEGRWSLVDRWESDGRRYVAVHANAPDQRDFRALSADERAVLRYMTLGASNKEIAFTLGLSMGSVAARVRTVVRKLGARTRRDLVGMKDADALPIDVEGERLAVLRSPNVAGSPLARGLTSSEQEVLELIVRGATNEEIARVRGRSVKTVANQVSSIFTKLGVESRTEAAAKVLTDARA